MDIQIKKNDALTVIASSVKLSIKETEQRILSFLKNHNEYISTEACGYSITDLSETEEFELKDMMNTCFIVLPENTEVEELLEGVFVWGLGSCPECGCGIHSELQEGDGFKWYDKSCLNCDYATSDEPDWDSMPGGYDDY